MAESSRDAAERHYRDLKRYIRETPPEKVERNQFGGAKRLKICKELGFDDSSLTSNKKINRLFRCLDKLLGADPKDRLPTARSDVERQLRALISKRDKRIEALQAENRTLKQAALGRGWFLPHGRMIRP